MKRIAIRWVSTLIVLLVLGGCERSPHTLARQVSDLSIPEDARVLSFEDKASGLFGQDQLTRIELEVSASEFAALTVEAREVGYINIGSTVVPPEHESARAVERSVAPCRRLDLRLRASPLLSCPNRMRRIPKAADTKCLRNSAVSALRGGDERPA
jgi:hypothetical protein